MFSIRVAFLRLAPNSHNLPRYCPLRITATASGAPPLPSLRNRRCQALRAQPRARPYKGSRGCSSSGASCALSRQQKRGTLINPLQGVLETRTDCAFHRPSKACIRLSSSIPTCRATAPAHHCHRLARASKRLKAPVTGAARLSQRQPCTSLQRLSGAQQQRAASYALLRL